MCKKIFIMLLLSCSIFTANAGLIDHSEITATTDLIEYSHPSFGTFSIDKIVDGITSDANPFNGFATNPSERSGIIHLAFSQAYDLSDFVLWNDINVVNEGIISFELLFYSALGYISKTAVFTVPSQGILSGQNFGFAAVNGVSRVDLNILTSNPNVSVTGIEIREVSFNGEISSSGNILAVPEPTSIILFGLGFIVLFYQNRIKRLLS